MGEHVQRRHFLAMGGAGAAAFVLGPGAFIEKERTRPHFSNDPFSLGVASGEPTAHGVVLWTRLAPKPLSGGGMPDRKVPVQWQVALDPGFRRVVQRGTEFARPELAHSVHVEVSGLDPAREYYYRFKVGPDQSPVGRTKTAPAPGSAPRGMAFAFASCQQYEHGYYTAYRHMADEDLDLVLHLGDYIYEYGPDEYTAPGGNVRHHTIPEVTTLDEYRTRHALYRSDADLQAAHAAFPWVVTGDDHEVENNYADATSERNSDRQKFLARRAAAYQAYYEHMPLRRASLPQGPDMRLYRRLAYGDLVRFHVLDTRQYRDDQAAGDGKKPPNPEQRNPERTITGARQERWLHRGLARSRARWEVLAQQVFFAELDFEPGPKERFNMDAWDGYRGSQRRVLDLLQHRGVTNPVVLTGDVHANWANNLKSDYDDPDSDTVGTEFVTTSISSGGNGSDVRPETAAILADNPHIKFFNNYRGYVRCTLSPEQFRADYRVVPYVSRPGAPVFTRASFVVEDGEPGAQLVGENESIPRGRRLPASA